MPHFSEKLVGVVLAGGTSARMGQDKSQLRMNDRTLLEHCLDRLDTQCSVSLCNLRQSQEAPPFRPCVYDPFDDARGPLAGIAAALAWMQQHASQQEWLLSITCDSPFIPEDLGQRLLTSAETNRKIIAVELDDRRHYLHALWHCSLLQTIVDYLEQGNRAVRGLLETHDAQFVSFPSTMRDSFYNINRPEDLAKALQISGRAHGSTPL